VAYSILTLQHLEREDAFQLLREIRRLLRPSGKAFFTKVLSAEYLASFIEYVEVSNPSRARFYTPGEVRCVLPAAGYEIVELRTDVEIEAVCEPRAASTRSDTTAAEVDADPTDRPNVL
jgi:hypothetical protein